MGARQVQSTPYTIIGTTTFDAAYKEFYEKALRSLIPAEFPIIDWVQKGKGAQKAKVDGKYLVFALETKLSGGFGFRGEGDVLPDADSMQATQGIVPWRKGIKGRIGLTWETMKFGKEGVGAFADVTKQEMDGAIKTMKYLAAPALWGDGTGILAKIAAVAGTTAIVPYSSELYNACFPGSRWLFEGLSVIACQAAAGGYLPDGTMLGAKKVAAINSDVSATLEAPNFSTDAADRYLVEHQTANSALTPSYGSVTLGTAQSYRGPMGLHGIVDDGSVAATYAGISTTTFPKWKSVVNHANGVTRTPSMALLYQMFGKLSRKTGNFKPGLTAWMNWDMMLTYEKLFEPFVQFAPRSLKPGFEEFDFMINSVRIPVEIDHFCPGYVFLLDPKVLHFAEPQPISIAKETGSQFRGTSNQDIYEVWFRWMFQLFSTERQRLGAIKDLTYTVYSV